jgi:hypothetical protein
MGWYGLYVIDFTVLLDRTILLRSFGASQDKSLENPGG